MAGSSPGTSDSASVQIRARPAARASLPPLTAETCFLTQFNSPMLAPHLSTAFTSPNFSSMEMPGTGFDISAEAPPEMSAMRRSSGPSADASASACSAAARLVLSGTGWLPWTTRRRCRVWV